MHRQRNVTKRCFLANNLFSLKQTANGRPLIKRSINKKKPYGIDTATNVKIMHSRKIKRKPFKVNALNLEFQETFIKQNEKI